jgi:hypothetical protein
LEALFGLAELALEILRFDKLLAVDRLGVGNLFNVAECFLAFVQLCHTARVAAMAHPNKWYELESVIKEGIAHLPKKELPASWTPQAAVDSEESWSDNVDDALRAFAEHGQWPELSLEETYYLLQRLQFGLHVARVLATPDKSKSSPFPPVFPNPLKSFSLDAQLVGLLIDGWKHEGRKHWLQAMERD